MKDRWLRILALAVLGGLACHGQSVLETLLGGTPNGVPAKVANLNTPAAVAADAVGNVYVALRGARQVVRIDPDGMVWGFAGNGTAGSTGDGGPATAAGLSQPAGLVFDSTNNLYIADAATHRIRKVSAEGIITTVAGNGTSGNSGDGGPATEASLNQPSALAFDPKGNLLIADTGNHEIRMVTPDGMMQRFAGTGDHDSSGDNGPALDATFRYPAGVAADPDGNVYISDSGNNQVRMVTPDGIIVLLAGRGGAAFRGDGGYATNAYLNNPAGLLLDREGTLYIADLGNVRVRRVTPNGIISSCAGTGTHGAAGDGGPARSANLNLLGIGFDAQNNLLIADGSSHRVRVVRASDGIIDTLAGNGLISYDPRGLLVEGEYVYFSDGASNRVRRYNLATRDVELVAGSGAAAFAGDDGLAMTASLNAPRGLARDTAGNLYIADSGNHRIRRIDTDGVITTIAGDGTATSTGDGDAATSATLNSPAGVAADAIGNIYIAESGGNRVRMIAVNGTISTVAGTGTAGAPDSESGVATDQNLSHPQGLAVEPAGTVLIADTNNNRVRRLTVDGNMVTVAGNGAAGFGGDGGAATAAMLKNPMGIAVDSAGNLYIAELQNQTVRRVDTDGLINTVAGLAAPDATRTGGYNGDGSPATLYSLNRPTAVVASGCTLLISDTSNQRLRRVWTAVDYTITTNPPGLQVKLDGQAATTPFTTGWLPETHHLVEAVSPQDGSPGTRYVSSEIQDIAVSCGPVRGSALLKFTTQYSLTVTADDGGAVSAVADWHDAGALAVLSATPNEGFQFQGWEGDCTGTADCQITMDSPKAVRPRFEAIEPVAPVSDSAAQRALRE
jgi:trimeric autotransporter adhesin